MIAALRGRLLLKDEGEIILEVNGVGYRILVPQRLIAGLGPRGSEAFVYTYMAVREDAQLLYGFQTWEERKIFSVLIGVSGVGPKMALGILNQLSQDELVGALLAENVSLLTSVNGIGKKTAQRLIVELKDKLSLSDASLVGSSVQVAASSGGSSLGEVVEALVALGYPQLVAARSAQNALRELGDEARVEDLIRSALKHCTNLEV